MTLYFIILFNMHIDNTYTPVHKFWNALSLRDAFKLIFKDLYIRSLILSAMRNRCAELRT